MREALNQPSAPSLDITSLGIQLTRFGNNTSPFLSADGKQFVFISSNRPSHSQGQVYLFNLENLKEKRITYQDGECSGAALLKDGRVVYASTTDENKERPRLLFKQDPAEGTTPTEIYLSPLNGDQIERLTRHPGLDAAPWPRQDRPDSILFSRESGKKMEILQMNIKSGQITPMLSAKDRSVESLRHSPNKKMWAWIETNGEQVSEVMISPPGFVAGKRKTLSLPVGHYRDLLWVDDQKLILSGKTLKKNYQLYSYDLNSNCLQNVFETETDLTFPQLHSERQALIFASTANGSTQIYYKSLPTSDQCLKWEESKANQ